MKRLATCLLLFLITSLSMGCHGGGLNMLSEPEEISLGEEAAPKFLKDYGGPIPSPSIQQYVSSLGMRIAAESERPQLPWEFHAVNSSVINAFALPGGKVFVTRGLLAELENEAMLVGVLGHEVGHVTGHHAGEQMTQALIIQGIAIGAGVAGAATDEDWLQVLGAGAATGGAVYLLSYGRGQELESDRKGLEYMTNLGYNPVGLMQVMEMFERQSAGARQPEFLSTHPHPESRIDQIHEIIKRDYPNYDRPGVYRFNQREYEQTVLAELRRLPAPPK